MKYSTFIAALPLLQLAAAQPHRRRHAHEHKLVKKDGDVVVTVVNTVYAEATDAPQVIVYVDADGKPVSTTTQGVSPAQTPAPAAPVAPAPVAPSAENVAAAPAVSYSAASEPVKTTSAPASTPTY